ncbi:hypothetical protein RRG08_060932 [Elysia crispata]|uniref:Uncharacterized protein n=1 Tax=Elysia crispata TaxID=231223 RepID=A0AAE1AVQ8_9GAST|nr:hypothetical protein RRG08_060932 [Elysia crispata]
MIVTSKVAGDSCGHVLHGCLVSSNRVSLTNDNRCSNQHGVLDPLEYLTSLGFHLPLDSLIQSALGLRTGPGSTNRKSHQVGFALSKGPIGGNQDRRVSCYETRSSPVGNPLLSVPMNPLGLIVVHGTRPVREANIEDGSGSPLSQEERPRGSPHSSNISIVAELFTFLVVPAPALVRVFLLSIRDGNSLLPHEPVGWTCFHAPSPKTKQGMAMLSPV